MPNPIRSALFRYGLAVLSVLLALKLTSLLWSFLMPSVSPLFFAAVMVSAWYGGLGPGLVATALAGLASAYFLMPPADSLLLGLDDLVQLTVFAFVAIVISSLNEQRKRAEDRVRKSNRELRESEERFRILANTAPVMVWMSGPDAQCTFFNKPWLDFTGRNLEQEINDGWKEGVHPEDLQHCTDIYTLAFQARQAYTVDYRLRRADSAYRWVLVTGVPRFTPEGVFAGYVGSAVDITDRKEAEQQREQLLILEQEARTEAEAASRMKDEFLSTLSHELRTPLNAMLGWTYMLRSGRLDEPTLTRGLETIERNAKAQAQLIEDLLDVSHIITGKLRLKVDTVELPTVIEAAIDSVRLAAEAKGINIQTFFESRASRVAGDSDRLQQVVCNLLSNAIKFTPRGGQIEVRLESDPSHARITISDTGKGIRPDFLPHVFEQFRQADSTITRSYSGLGMGLAIVRHLVELHGGTVQAESKGEGQGATFTVNIPGAPSRREPSQAEQGGPATPSQNPLNDTVPELGPDNSLPVGQGSRPPH
jgi:PAS domain S-box-containing protein